MATKKTCSTNVNCRDLTSFFGEPFPAYPDRNSFHIPFRELMIFGTTIRKNETLVRHVTIGHPSRDPSWDELRLIRDRLFDEHPVIMGLPYKAIRDASPKHIVVMCQEVQKEEVPVVDKNGETDQTGGENNGTNEAEKGPGIGQL